MTFEAECEDKVRHFDKAAAKKAIRRMRGRVGELNAYRCSHCKFWHVGHGNTAKRTRKRTTNLEGAK